MDILLQKVGSWYIVVQCYKGIVHTESLIDSHQLSARMFLQNISYSNLTIDKMCWLCRIINKCIIIYD